MPKNIDHLEKAGEAFQDNYQASGIEACRNMVQDLYVISEATRILMDSIDRITEESLGTTGRTSGINLESCLELAEGLEAESELATSEYDFAKFLLKSLE